MRITIVHQPPTFLAKAMRQANGRRDGFFGCVVHGATVARSFAESVQSPRSYSGELQDGGTPEKVQLHAMSGMRTAIAIGRSNRSGDRLRDAAADDPKWGNHLWNLSLCFPVSSRLMDCRSENRFGGPAVDSPLTTAGSPGASPSAGIGIPVSRGNIDLLSSARMQAEPDAGSRHMGGDLASRRTGGMDRGFQGGSRHAIPRNKFPTLIHALS